MTRQHKFNFEVHPSVIYQLGESLISDPVQALIELVKNCYDADASYAKIVIDTKSTVDIPDSVYAQANGQIIIEDDGHGMDLETIESGWFLISSRKKRELKQAKKTTPGGRTPLGDKGLGRLGSQRLGEQLEVFTKSAKEPGYHFAFSWTDFATAPKLGDVSIHLNETNSIKAPGTKVIVSNLCELDIWRGEGAIKQLELELSRMISPYKQIKDFMVYIEVDGKVIELFEISEKVRDLAPIRYDISFDGKILSVKGRVRLDFFRPNSSKEADQFSLIAESDNGRAFYKFLSQSNKAKLVNLRLSQSKQWYVEVSFKKPLNDIDKIEPETQKPNEIANPGPFVGGIDSFDLSSGAYKQQSVFHKQKEYREYIKEQSGIRVYRDGFAIRVDHDWLKLGAQWTSASSYFGLKPNNTLGYIALSARDNMVLEETTDREGFKETPYYHNFYALLTEFRNFTGITHGFFGRSWADFRKKRNEELARVDTRQTVEDLSQSIKKGLSGAPQYRKTLESLQVGLDKGVNDSNSIIAKMETAKEITPKLKQQVIDTLGTLESTIQRLQEAIPLVIKYLDELGSLEGKGQVLEDRVDSMRRQLDDMYETVALGLTAEALSHEVFNIADQLALRAKAARTQLKKKDISDRIIQAFVENVHSSVMALRKQVSFLSPALRYVREQRETILVAEFLEELQDFYKDRLSKSNINISVPKEGDNEFYIRINKGKILQIIDNFVNNSEYWLKEDIGQKRISEGTIIFEVERPFLRISDNGRGIDPAVEHAIFEPFISAKGKGKGRGLGLFIVKQLLDSDGCHVGVVPERNRYKRLYKFQIDLRGVLSD